MKNKNQSIDLNENSIRKMSLFQLSSIFLFLLAATAFQVNAAKHLQKRIVGGTKAAASQFPYQVSIRNTKNRMHMCGGVIINSKFILTAGHCFWKKNYSPDQIYTVVGALRYFDNGVEYKIADYHLHPSFEPLFTLNDISLLLTASEIIFTESIQPIALPTSNVTVGTTAIVSGWGLTSVCE